MRLWHKDLVRVLPRQQLLGQWRECCAIAKSIAENGTPNHILVNKVMDYPLNHFARYMLLVASEMARRNYKVDINKVSKVIDDSNIERDYVYFPELYADWHNSRYLMQCYYNLQEKYDCGGITEEEWEKIEEKVKGVMN